MSNTDSIPSIVDRKRARALDEASLRTIFLDARTANHFLDHPVPHGRLERAVELAQLGPTSANAVPLRIIFVESPAAKARLLACVSEGNVAKTNSAPVTAIIACDPKFYEQFPRTFPHRGADMRARFEGPEKAEAAVAFAWDNALLQMGYFTLALRALGLDCGAMGGFDRAKVNAEFFADGSMRAVYLLNIGYGDDSKVLERLPRLATHEVATFV